MRISRLLAIVGLLLSTWLVTTAQAASVPSHPITIIVPFPPGGGADVATRIIGEDLSQRLGEPIIIENRSGANGLIGIGDVAPAAPNGYTIS